MKRHRGGTWVRSCFLTCLHHPSHLSSHVSPFPHPPPPPPLPPLFLPLSALFFSSFCALLFVQAPNVLTAFPQRAPISATLDENRGLGCCCRWGYFKSCFLILLSHYNTHPSNFSMQSPSPHRPPIPFLCIVAGVTVVV